MYNFYQFDKVEKEEERRIRTSAHNPRKLVKYLCKIKPTRVNLFFGHWISKEF